MEKEGERMSDLSPIQLAKSSGTRMSPHSHKNETHSENNITLSESEPYSENDITLRVSLSL